MTDHTPQCVKDVLDKPGLYCLKYGACFVYLLIDKEKQVHQCNLHTLEPDGILSPGGWVPGLDAVTLTPIKGQR